MPCAYSCIKSLGCHDASDVTTYRVTAIGVAKWGVPENNDGVPFIITETEVTDHLSAAAISPHSGGNALGRRERLLPPSLTPPY
jgi:hypothetical protein